MFWFNLILLTVVSSINGESTTEEPLRGLMEVHIKPKTDVLRNEDSEQQTRIKRSDSEPAAITDKNEKREKLREAYKKKLLQYCTENRRADSYEDAVHQVFNFLDCFQNHLNLSVVMQEFAVAQVTGNVDEVVQKYCAVVPKIKPCLFSLTAGIASCVSRYMYLHNNVNKFNTGVVERLLDYLCYNHGERIGYLIAQGGLQCLFHQLNITEEFRYCRTLVGEPVMLMVMKNLLHYEDKCGPYEEFTKCVKSSLELKCATPAPAKMMESILRHIMTDTPCDKKNKFGETQMKN